MNEKRGTGSFVVVVLFAVAILCAPYVLGGYCLNPASYDYCQQVTEEVCCGGTCSSGQYSSLGTPPADCELGCCFAVSGNIQKCAEGLTYKGLCFSEQGNYSVSCDLIPECEAGCCCWFENTKQSNLLFKGECNLKPSNVFYSGIIDTFVCAQQCNTSIQNGTNVTQTQCSDQVDNDLDTKVDYPEDPGCNSTADQSEADPNIQCDDGIDNDQDGIRTRRTAVAPST